MELDFWQQRWHENQTGFHLSDVNPCLLKYWPLFGGEGLDENKPATVFVPLCGKSLDLIWLASQSYSVIGVECSEKAVDAFFSEQSLSVQKEKSENFNIYKSEQIKLFQGDFFQLSKHHLASVSAVYDRASLVALPEAMRRRYVKHLAAILPASVSILLVTLEYDQALMAGPPFSLSETEVEQLYGSDFEIELLCREDIIDEQARFKERGLRYMFERVFKISR
ncbi:Thiopurine S-methyltransferase [hydrothermal vent metagenome]|uniref:thiopurine S-methyltransferase n=1 Tax=hydrothermal vent metagenome TaxID=652676 RepID=A0A3B0XNW7_9ZZZZ